MILPSNELLSAVLGECCKESRRLNYSNLVYFCGLQWKEYEINVYELMHKMKKYAYEHGCIILSRVDGFCTCNEVDYISDTEFEAVAKACEWILEQQK